MNKLREGDIIEVKKGMHVEIKVPLHFICKNDEGNFDETSGHTIVIGNHSIGFDTNFLQGEYVVTYSGRELRYTGGHNDITEEYVHLVKAEKILDNDYDYKAKILFYQEPDSKFIKTGRAVAKWQRKKSE